MSERKVSQKSLENLKLGGASRNMGKIRCTVTILPETKKWLSRGGNLSGRIDELVDKYLRGELVGRRALDESQARCKALEAEVQALKKKLAN